MRCRTWENKSCCAWTSKIFSHRSISAACADCCIALGYGYPVAAILSTLMTEAPRQPVMVGDICYFPPIGPRACPQGAPTSPGLSNALLVKMDHRLAGLARRFGFSYTRYADDLTFSGDDIDAAHALRLLATRIVGEEGFAINVPKTRLVRGGSCQTVTGVVVNDVLGLVPPGAPTPARRHSPMRQGARAGQRRSSGRWRASKASSLICRC